MGMDNEFEYLIFSNPDWKHIAKYGMILNIVISIAVGIITYDATLGALTFLGFCGLLGYRLYEDKEKNLKLRRETKQEPALTEADKTDELFWKCIHCGRFNSIKVPTCQVCGAKRNNI